MTAGRAAHRACLANLLPFKKLLDKLQNVWYSILSIKKGDTMKRLTQLMVVGIVFVLGMATQAVIDTRKPSNEAGVKALNCLFKENGFSYRVREHDNMLALVVAPPSEKAVKRAWAKAERKHTRLAMAKSRKSRG